MVFLYCPKCGRNKWKWLGKSKICFECHVEMEKRESDISDGKDNIHREFPAES